MAATTYYTIHAIRLHGKQKPINEQKYFLSHEAAEMYAIDVMKLTEDEFEIRSGITYLSDDDYDEDSRFEEAKEYMDDSYYPDNS